MAGKAKPKKKGSRYTPPKRAASSATRGPIASRSNGAGGPAGTPPPEAAAQVGRRPSPPALLFTVAAMWLVAAVVIAVRLDAAWKLVPTVVFVGLGLFYLRAALQTVVRRDRGADEHAGGR